MGVLGAFSSLAFAASNVTLYGIIEEGVIVQKAKHGDNKVELNSGFGQGSAGASRVLKISATVTAPVSFLNRVSTLTTAMKLHPEKLSTVNLSCMLKAASAPSVSAVQALCPSRRLRLS